MIADLKPYGAYKDSGLPWLGQVPEHWSISRIKTVLQELDCRSTDGDGTLLSLTRVRGLIPHSERTDKIHSAKTLVGYKRYQPGEIVMNRMQAWSGMFGAGPSAGLVSPDYAVFKILDGHDTRLVLERLKTPDLVGQFALESKGIGSGFNRLYTDRLGPIPISLPPLEEQAAIVRFLDWANGRLERTIRAKRRVIALLTEQKQAIIHRAVTRGIDPAVPLKPSGIPWLGDIPAHWTVKRAKYVFREIDDHSITGQEEQLSVSHLTGVTPRSEKNITMFKAASYVGHKICHPGDLAVNTMWAWMAALGISRHAGIISPAYAVYRQPSPQQLLGSYADHLLRTQPYTSNYKIRSTGVRASRLRLYPEEFLKIPIVIPPIEEQGRIVDAFTIETRSLNAAIFRIEHEIEFLREYRTRLIADVVTGKLDVREAAARLPQDDYEAASVPDGLAEDESEDSDEMTEA